MRREIGFGARAAWRRPLLGLLLWSVPEVLPTAVMGYAVAQAVDRGFLRGRPGVGLAWLGVLFAASLLGGIGSRRVYRRLGELVEPLRDGLAHRIVGGAVSAAADGEREDGAVARLTRQLEIVRDTFAGLVLLIRGFSVMIVGVSVGLASLSPIIAGLILPPFLIGIGLYGCTLGLAAKRYRAAVSADERLAAEAGAVLAGACDLVYCGTESHGASMVAGRAREQARAEVALARLAALRTGCFVVGAWVPLLVLLFAGPWLVRQGASAGMIMGGLTYILFGLQPALNQVVGGAGDSGLRFIVTLGRILDAGAEIGEPEPVVHSARGDVRLRARGLEFSYGPGSEPIVAGLDFDVDEGEHLAIVGPSGAGKSTLANLLCGLLHPNAGEVSMSGSVATRLSPAELAARRVLIPQEAYVFTGSVNDNLTYLNPHVPQALVDEALERVGADKLVSELGGGAARLVPAELSAAQRQLLALARAYLSPAPLAVLDEATCHLDPAAEEHAELGFASRGGALIVIAHRISSATRAGRILIMDGERSVSGTHDELLSRSALYRDLVTHWTR
ncbi:MAG: ATP-binding cassette domain-containing protein [Stackebrandtia sp.]